MANVGIAAFVAVGIVTMLLILRRIAPGQRRRRTRAIAGLVPGLLGAGVVLALTTDIVPDSVEAAAIPWVIVAVTAGMIALTAVNLSRH